MNFKILPFYIYDGNITFKIEFFLFKKYLRREAYLLLKITISTATVETVAN